MKYDGKGKLAEAIADLCGLSVKSQAQIAILIKQAKEALGVTSKAKVLPADVRLAIYKWHYDRLNSVQDIKQDDVFQDTPQSSLNDAVQDVKQTNDDVLVMPIDNAVYNIKQDIPEQDNDVVDSSVQDVKQDNPVQIEGDTDNSVYDFKQIHFAVTITHNGKPKRTTVMLEGYLVKALQRKHALTDNSAIRAWLEQAIKADSRFNSSEPLTQQVKRIIIESFV